MECVVLSIITNLAAGMQAEITCEEVGETLVIHGPTLAKFVATLVEQIDLTWKSNIKLKLDEYSSEDYKMFIS